MKPTCGVSVTNRLLGKQIVPQRNWQVKKSENCRPETNGFAREGYLSAKKISRLRAPARVNAPLAKSEVCGGGGGGGTRETTLSPSPAANVRQGLNAIDTTLPIAAAAPPPTILAAANAGEVSATAFRAYSSAVIVPPQLQVTAGGLVR